MGVLELPRHRWCSPVHPRGSFRGSAAYSIWCYCCWFFFSSLISWKRNKGLLHCATFRCWPVWIELNEWMNESIHIPDICMHYICVISFLLRPVISLHISFFFTGEPVCFPLSLFPPFFEHVCVCMRRSIMKHHEVACHPRICLNGDLALSIRWDLSRSDWPVPFCILFFSLLAYLCDNR